MFSYVILFLAANPIIAVFNKEKSPSKLCNIYLSINLVGVQLESYYMDGQLWNKHYYNKVHERISSDFDEVGTCIKKSLQQRT